MSFKTRSTQILSLGFKLVHHRRAQNFAGARWILNKQSALPHRPLRGRTLSGAPTPRDMVEKRPRARLTVKINPKSSLRPRLPPFAAAAAGDDAPLSSSPFHRPKNSSLARWRFPVAIWLGFRHLRWGYQRRTHRRRRPTPSARCSAVCLVGRFGQRRRAYDGGAVRG
jgi:hypothetical protein